MQTGRTPCEDTGRDGDEASRSQAMPKIDSKPLDVMGETRDRSRDPHNPQKEPTLILNF